MNSIEDYMICDKCGENMQEYSTDEIDFGNDNDGHYIVDCWCPNCKNSKRAYIHFRYEITDFHYR